MIKDVNEHTRCHWWSIFLLWVTILFEGHHCFVVTDVDKSWKTVHSGRMITSFLLLYFFSLSLSVTISIKKIPASSYRNQGLWLIGGRHWTQPTRVQWFFTQHDLNHKGTLMKERFRTKWVWLCCFYFFITSPMWSFQIACLCVLPRTAENLLFHLMHLLLSYFFGPLSCYMLYVQYETGLMLLPLWE